MLPRRRPAFCLATSFFEDNVRYNYGRRGTRLNIGKYCAIAHGAIFVMADANHSMAGVSTYPFSVFGVEWAANMPLDAVPFPDKGSITIGHDVWIGMEACIMPGVTIGNSAIIGTRALVTKDVPDYAIVAGNPAKLIRPRFQERDIAILNRLKWWDWPHQCVTNAVSLLVEGRAPELQVYAEKNGLCQK